MYILCTIYCIFRYGRSHAGSSNAASSDNEQDPASVIRRLTSAVASGEMAATSLPSGASRSTPTASGYSAAKSSTATTPTSATTSMHIHCALYCTQRPSEFRPNVLAAI